MWMFVNEMIPVVELHLVHLNTRPEVLYALSLDLNSLGRVSRTTKRPQRRKRLALR